MALASKARRTEPRLDTALHIGQSALVRRLRGWLRPRSAEGTVYREPGTEYFELIWFGFMLFFAVCGVVLAISGNPWGIGFAAASLALGGLARLAFFRPHVVVGEDTLVLVGIFHTRRIAYERVRRVTEVGDGLNLVLTDYEEIAVPGHWMVQFRFGGNWAEHGKLMNAINERVAARFDAGPEAANA